MSYTSSERSGQLEALFFTSRTFLLAHINSNLIRLFQEGAKEEGPFIIDANWGIAHYVQGYE